MKLFWSATNIPELKNLPLEIARPIWRRCWWNNAEGSGIVVVLALAGELVGESVAGTELRTLGRFIGSVICVAIGYPFSIALLRPKIRRQMGIESQP